MSVYWFINHRCLWLSRTTSRSISRYFERVPLLTRFRANAEKNSLHPCTRSWFYLYNMPFLVLWYSWPRLLRIPTESISTSKLSCVGFRCKEFDPLVLWIWNQNIAISTIVGTSSHINNFFVCLFVFVFVFVFFCCLFTISLCNVCHC